MDLIHDVLDHQLIDGKGRRVGRVDGMVLEIFATRPPRVTTLEVGMLPLARRLHPRIARWLRAIAARLGTSIDPVTIPVTAIRKIGLDITLELDANQESQLLATEQWLNDYIISHIPGGKKSGTKNESSRT